MKKHLFAALAFVATLLIAEPVFADGGTVVVAMPNGDGMVIANRGTIAYGDQAQGRSVLEDSAVQAFILNGVRYVQSNNGYFAAGAASAAPSGGYQQGTPLNAQIQAILRQQGYYLGPLDGIDDSRTEQSIEAFQRDHHLPITGQITGGLIEAMGVQ
jgi:hypothetical protein